MANIFGLVTNNGKQYLEVDADPSSGAGTPASIGSIATFQSGSVGTEWVKVGANDTDWDKVVTFNSGTNVANGIFLRLPIYDTIPSAPHVGDTAIQNGQNLHVGIVSQPTRTSALNYNIPNPGDSISSADFVLTEGAQFINGIKTFQDSVIVNGDLTVNGTLTFLNSTQTTISDPRITLNKGGAIASGGGSGFEIEEAALISAFFKQSAGRNGWDFKACAFASVFSLDQSLLSTNRSLSIPDSDGIFVVRSSSSPGVSGQVSFYQDPNNLISSANLFFDHVNGRLGIGNNVPSSTLHVTGSARITSLSAATPVASDVNGNLLNRTIVLSASSDVSGILPIGSGGTNSNTALNNNRVMVSSGGSIIENAIQLTLGSVFFANTNGLPNQDNSNFFWDSINARLGLGTPTPSRRLDVKGSSIFRSPILYQDDSVASVSGSFETFQAMTQTTDAASAQLASIVIPNNSEVVIEARIMGYRTGGSAGSNGDSAVYVRTARFKNISGVVTLKSLQTDYTSEDQASWDGTLVVSGSTVLIRVLGATNNNIDWFAQYSVQTLQ